jgi:hypothetical protein
MDMGRYFAGDPKRRTRQNVLLELLYLIAKNRAGFCILYSPGIFRRHKNRITYLALRPSKRRKTGDFHFLYRKVTTPQLMRIPGGINSFSRGYTCLLLVLLAFRRRIGVTNPVTTF